MEGSKLAAAILGEVRRAVVGKDEVLAKVLLAILAGGHILLEDIPGVGKTTMALAFSRALSLRYNRVQFTPDVMPSDITGFTLYNKEAGRMEYQPGAVLCNLFLADELNRATSRTQSALLEAMEEGQVTVDGVSHPVPQPFLVIATQNPAGPPAPSFCPTPRWTGSWCACPSATPPPPTRWPWCAAGRGAHSWRGCARCWSSTACSPCGPRPDRSTYPTRCWTTSCAWWAPPRSHPMILQGASPRATLALTAMAKAAALVRGRDYVLPEDVSLVFGDVVPHRLLLSPRAEADRSFDPVSELLERVPAPRIS